MNLPRQSLATSHFPVYDEKVSKNDTPSGGLKMKRFLTLSVLVVNGRDAGSGCTGQVTVSQVNPFESEGLDRETFIRLVAPAADASRTVVSALRNIKYL